jgi:hypothetical protein
MNRQDAKDAEQPSEGIRSSGGGLEMRITQPCCPCGGVLWESDTENGSDKGWDCDECHAHFIADQDGKPKITR